MKTDNIAFYLEKPLQNLLSDDGKAFLHSEWYRYMFQYIPFVTGVLASTVDMSAEKNVTLSPAEAMEMGLNQIEQTKTYIHFKAPYASYQNDGLDFNFTKDLHPLAQAQWAQVAADLHGEQIMNATKKYILRGVK